MFYTITDDKEILWLIIYCVKWVRVREIMAYCRDDNFFQILLINCKQLFAGKEKYELRCLGIWIGYISVRVLRRKNLLKGKKFFSVEPRLLQQRLRV
jgi:hypothetical protein